MAEMGAVRHIESHTKSHTEFEANELMQAQAVKRVRVTFNPAKQASTPEHELQRALLMQATLGTKAAATYLRKRQWSLDAALRVLVGTVREDFLLGT